MAPEYAINDVVSIKVDVFSFGVLLLEILSGKKNNSRYDSDRPLNLIGYAWQLWNEGRALELADPTLNELSSQNEVLRCIHIGLLCVQELAKDRPAISNDAIQLPQRKQPAFFINVIVEESEVPYSSHGSPSPPEKTLTLTNPGLRLLSTFNSSGECDTDDKKWKQSLLSLRDKYAVDGQAALEMINSRQALLNETIQNLSVLPSDHTFRPQIQKILCEKLKNSNKMDMLMRMSDLLVKEDELSVELASYRLTYLQDIIDRLTTSASLSPPPQFKNCNELVEGLMSLRLMRLELLRSSSNPTLKQCKRFLDCEQEVQRWLCVLMGLPEQDSIGIPKSLEVRKILKNSFHGFHGRLPPPLDHAGWRKKWSDLYERCNKANETLLRLRREPNTLTSLCEKVKNFNLLSSLKEMIMKEQELSAQLTISRLTSLQEIINNFSDEDRYNDMWSELNEGLIKLREMEVKSAQLLAVRITNELSSLP